MNAIAIRRMVAESSLAEHLVGQVSSLALHSPVSVSPFLFLAFITGNDSIWQWTTFYAA
jgi:hypothetical protein